MTLEELITREDLDLVGRYIGHPREPDLIIAPDGNPYVYRWYLHRDEAVSNTYFHIQVADDPMSVLHDHPWHNVSFILSGGYDELLDKMPNAKGYEAHMYHRVKGEVIFRQAHWAHRLFLPILVPYTMTLFVTGPKIRDWGYWYPDGWHHQERHNILVGNETYHMMETV